jgi:hypothetical protein
MDVCSNYYDNRYEKLARILRQSILNCVPFRPQANRYLITNTKYNF